jgi:hypothetical protein
LLGNEIDLPSPNSFLSAREVTSACPKLAVGRAGVPVRQDERRLKGRPYGDRVLLIGDAGVTLNDGIGSAYRTKAAACVAYEGV